MSRVTLDELLKKVGIVPSQLDEPCTRQHLQDIALFLESWRTVARHLGLSNVKVDEVERDGVNEKEKRLKILESWKAKFAFKANYRMLIETLLKCEEADQAEQVCHLLKSQYSRKGTLAVYVNSMLASVSQTSSQCRFFHYHTWEGSGDCCNVFIIFVWVYLLFMSRNINYMSAIFKQSTTLGALHIGCKITIA